MEQLTLWSEEAHAKHFQSQTHEKGLMICAASSCSNISELAQKLTQNGLSGRTFQVYSLPMVAETLQHCSIAFQNSGVLAGEGGHGECLTLNTSEYPNDVKESTLSSILTTGDVPSTCFMTVQACRGILARLDKRPKLSEPAGLSDACQEAIKSNVA